MSSLYYLGLSVATLSMSIYNFDYHTQGKQVQCYKTLSMTFDQYLQYNISHNQSTAGAVNSTQLFQIEAEESNGYKSLFLLIGILFIIFFFMSLYLSIVINSLANQLPSDFVNVSLFKKINACFCKVFPMVFIAMSWLIFALIIIAWGFTANKHCTVSKSSDLTKPWSPSKYYNDAVVLNAVNTGIWFLMHYVGALVRQLVYVEPFMYAPIINKDNVLKVWFTQYLGP